MSLKISTKVKNKKAETFRVTQPFSELGYVKNKRVKDYLKHIYLKRTGCLVSNVQILEPKYASYAIQTSSKIEDNFPLREEYYNDSNIKKIRDWYNNQ